MTSVRLIAHSIRALTRYKLRTGFMMVGSIVGVAALTFVISVGQGAERAMIRTVHQLFGASSIMIIAGGNHLMGGPRPDAARLTIDDIDEITTTLPEIDTWDPQQFLSASIRHGDAATTARVVGQSEQAERVWGRGVSRGEYFGAGAIKRSDRVALIGETVVKELFAGKDPIDAEILIESVTFRVIGVLDPLGTDLHGMDRDNEIAVPISTLMRRVMNEDTIAAAKLLVHDSSRIEETAQEVRRMLRARHALSPAQPDDFHLVTPIEIQRTVGRVRRILSVYLPLASAIALLVGGIVAGTLMLMSVNARVSEIGLRRAVGARPDQIWLQFVVETAVTMLGGGVVGAVLGLVVGQLVASRLQLGEIFSWGVVMLAILVSIVTGVLAGVLPARRAARLHPVDALR